MKAYENAIAAIEEVFGDTTVALSSTIENLEAIRDHANDLVSVLIERMEAE